MSCEDYQAFRDSDTTQIYYRDECYGGAYRIDDNSQIAYEPPDFLTANITAFAAQPVTFNLSLPAGSKVVIDWGDNTSSTVAGPVAAVDYVHTYAANGAYKTRFLGDYRALTHCVLTSGGSFSGSLADLPSGLTYFYCTGSNTISGSLADLPSGLTSFTCTGSNTISGSLADLPSGLTYFYCTGSNTISDYVTRSWANNMTRVYCIPVAPGGLDSSEIDQLLIDLAAAGGTWVAPKEVNLTGVNAAPGVDGLAARDVLVDKGVTVTVNP